MLKLYRRNAGRIDAYHEAWVHGSKITEHWGPLGERGESREHRRNKKLSEDENLKHVLKRPIVAGYEPFDTDDHAVLLIEFSINEMGSTEDLGKRHALEERMNETLGWAGLGHCDGGSIGSGTMEVCCLVVDFEIAKRVIKDELKGTKFADYSRIYDERAADPSAAPDAGTKSASQGTGVLVPPWIICPGVDRKDAGWQSGKPSEHLANWVAWFRSLPAEAQVAYATVFHEPKGWSGFYDSVKGR